MGIKEGTASTKAKLCRRIEEKETNCSQPSAHREITVLNIHNSKS